MAVAVDPAAEGRAIGRDAGSVVVARESDAWRSADADGRRGRRADQSAGVGGRRFLNGEAAAGHGIGRGNELQSGGTAGHA